MLHNQIAESIRRLIASGELKPGDRLPPVREMAKRWGCTPATVARAYSELVREGLLTTHRKGGTRVALSLLHPQYRSLRLASLVQKAENFLMEAVREGFSPKEAQVAFSLALARWEEIQRLASPEEEHPLPDRKLRFAGSHDLIVEQLPAMLEARGRGFSLELNFTGSLGGLIALLRREADIAGIHLWDETTGSYNIPFVRRVLSGQRVSLLTLAHRYLGLIVPRGNPKGLKSIADLARPDVTFINRQRGSGTRVWLDEALRKEGIAPSAVRGYEREQLTHLGVARAVAEGEADVGLGIYSAALAFGLDFVPLTLERYDLVIPEGVRESPPVMALVEVVRSEEFIELVRTMGGYETHETGNETWL